MDNATRLLEQLLEKARQEGYEQCRADMMRLMDSLPGVRQLVVLTDENCHDFKDVLEISLRTSTLPSRVINALWRDRIHTVSDLAFCTLSSLKDVPDIGPQAIAACENFLKQYGLRLE